MFNNILTIKPFPFKNSCSNHSSNVIFNKTSKSKELFPRLLVGNWRTFNFIGTRTSTSITTKTRCFQHYRYMHSGNSVPELSVYVKSNAFHIYGQALTQDPTGSFLALEPYVDESVTYVAIMLDDKVSFSNIILESEKNLSYPLHKQSFVEIIQSLRKLPETGLTEEVISDLDDLNIYNNGQDLKSNWENIFDISFNEISKIKMITSQVITETQEESSTTDSDTDSHHSFPVSSSTSSSRSSTPEGGYDFDCDGQLFNNGNNNTIILLTLVAFITIKGLAWFFKDNEKKESSTEDEEGLNSIYESSGQLLYIQQKLIMILIPSFIIILYQFRYYYY